MMATRILRRQQASLFSGVTARFPCSRPAGNWRHLAGSCCARRYNTGIRLKLLPPADVALDSAARIAVAKYRSRRDQAYEWWNAPRACIHTVKRIRIPTVTVCVKLCGNIKFPCNESGKKCSIFSHSKRGNDSKPVSLTLAAQCRAGFEPLDERRLAEQKSPVLASRSRIWIYVG